MNNRRLTLIRTALVNVDKAKMHVRFSHNPLMTALRQAERWLKAAKQHTLDGQKELADMTIGNATTHLQLVLAQIEEAVS